MRNALLAAGLAMASISCTRPARREAPPPTPPPVAAESAKPAATETLAAEPVREVTVEEAAAALAATPAVTVLDVRTPEEFAAGHLPGAINLDFHAQDFEERVRALDHGATYLVHCQAGGRSAKARDLMVSDGFTSLLHLGEGFEGWAAAGQAVEAP